MKKIIFYCLGVLLHVHAFAQQKTHFINPFPIKPPGYTHVVATSGTTTLYISGQVPVDEKGEIIGKGDLEIQTRQVFKNLGTCLRAAGADYKDLVKITIFVKDYKGEMLAVIRKVRNEFLDAQQPPASTLVGVQSLFKADVLIEIDAIAVVNEKDKP